MFNKQDKKHMEIALSLAKRGVGLTAPNPSVGCVIVKNDVIIARANTAAGGRPHAETIALGIAGRNAKGATAYVTLEPCSHHGKTPPCSDALIKSGIKRAVIAAIDPNPKVCGNGIAKLKKAGIKTEVGVFKKEAEEINSGFFKVIKKSMPYVTLKLALTADGKIISQQGGWFTCEAAKNFAHILRYKNDAIMVGKNTVIADDPALTCRLPGLEEFSPIRIIMGKEDKIPKNAKCRPAIFIEQNSEGNHHSTLTTQLSTLTQNGITRLLVEGGGKLAECFLKAKLVDELIIIESPDVIGDKSAPDIRKMLFENNYLKKESQRKIGSDLASFYK